MTVIVDVRWTPREADSSVEYLAPDGTVAVQLAPESAPAPGRIAGMEGLGSELFFDASGELCALELSLPIFKMRVRPAAAMWSAPGEVRPGALIARALPKGPLGARCATLSDPFGAAVFAFESIDPDDPDTHELVALGSGVVAAVSCLTGALSLVQVQGLDRRQRVLGQAVSVDGDGPAFMNALNAIHMAFLTEQPAEFAARARPLAAAARDERLSRLVELYARMRAVDAAIEAADEHPK
jgi:hypothetical protein